MASIAMFRSVFSSSISFIFLRSWCWSWKRQPIDCFFSKNTPFASFKMCEIFCSLWCCQLENFLRLFLSIYQLKAKHQIKTIKKFPNFIQCQQSSIYVLGQRMQSRSSSTLKVFFINSKQFLLDKLIFLSWVQKSVSWPSLSWPARYF